MEKHVGKEKPSSDDLEGLGGVWVSGYGSGAVG